MTASALVHGEAPGRAPHGPVAVPPALVAAPARPATASEILELLLTALQKLDDLAAELADTKALLVQVDGRCARLEATSRAAPIEPTSPRPPPAGPGPVVAPAEDVEIASDADLDGKYGNETIKRDPPRWPGESYVGYRLSECSPDYLETMASFHDWRARQAPKEGKDPKWAKLDAARCRGWARRIRLQAAEAPPRNAASEPDDLGDDIPF